MKKMNAVTVDFDHILNSMRDLSRESSDYFLDKTTGKVITLSRPLMASFENEGRDDESDLPSWDAQMIPLGREIILKGSANFVRIPEAYGQPEHKWMTEFAQDLRPAKLKDRVLKAMKGRGACKRFKTILSEYPDDMRRWAVVRKRFWKEKIQDWLQGEGVLGIETKLGRAVRTR